MCYITCAVWDGTTFKIFIVQIPPHGYDFIHINPTNRRWRHSQHAYSYRRKHLWQFWKTIAICNATGRCRELSELHLHVLSLYPGIVYDCIYAFVRPILLSVNINRHSDRSADWSCHTRFVPKLDSHPSSLDTVMDNIGDLNEIKCSVCASHNSCHTVLQLYV